MNLNINVKNAIINVNLNVNGKTDEKALETIFRKGQMAPPEEANSLMPYLTKILGKNISAERVAKAAKVPLDSVYRRIYDLRKTGFRVMTTSKTVKGTRQQFYSVA